MITTSENGGTCNEIGLRCLRKIFLPEPAEGLHVDEHRILILDGHGSHATINFMYDWYINNVHLIYLPTHHSHILQPLHLCTFAPLKAQYRPRIVDLAMYHDAAPVKKKRFVKCFADARQEASAECLLRGGWKAAWITPFARSKGMNSSQPCHTTPTAPSHESVAELFLRRSWDTQSHTSISLAVRVSARLSPSTVSIFSPQPPPLLVATAASTTESSSALTLLANAALLTQSRPDRMYRKRSAETYRN
jgi:hypothetical protein